MKSFKMKKGKIEKKMFGVPNEFVDGYISRFFGIHKNNNDRYVVTHLKSGLKVTEFSHLKIAREFIFKLETDVFPFAWDLEPEILSANYSSVKAIFQELTGRFFSSFGN